MKNNTAQLIGRAQPLGAANGLPKAILVLPAGEQTVISASKDAEGQHPQILCNVTRRSALNMEAARRVLVGQGRPPFFDYCHEGVLGTNDRRSGVPTRFWWDPVRGVMADVQWTAAAAQALTGSVPEYDAFSPHVPIGDATSAAPGEAFGCYQNCGGLVNIGTFGPKIRFTESADMQTLVAADPNLVAEIAALPDEPTQPAAKETLPEMNKLKEKLCAAYGLDASTATEDDLIAAFDAQQSRVQTMTGRDKAVIVALGIADAEQANVTAEQLTGKLATLISVEDHVNALTGVAVHSGLIAPAEKDVWARRLKGADRAAETKELLAKKPSVPLQQVTQDAAVQKGAAANTPKWKTACEELIAKSPELQKLPSAEAISRAMEQLARENPSALQEAPATK